MNSEDAFFLTTERFWRTRSETKNVLEKLKKEATTDLKLIDKIEEEDILLKVKNKSYKKCRRKLIATSIIIFFCFIFRNVSPMFYGVIIMSSIVFISSFFGVFSNKLSKSEREYITK